MTSIPKPKPSSSQRSAGAAALAVAALAFTGSAQARDDLSWSIGVASPGVSIGVSNSRPVFVAPAPIYVQPAPIYMRPSPIFVQPGPFFMPPQVVYVQPAPVLQPGWAPRGHAHGWHKKHGHHGGHPDDDRRGSGRGEYGGYHGQNQLPPPHAHGYGQVAPLYPQGGYYRR